MIRLAFALFLASCLRTPPVQRISVIDWPARIEITNAKPDCHFPDPSAELEEPAWPLEHEDYYRRQYVHRRDYGLAIEHIRDQDQRISSLVECVRALTNPQ